MNPTITFDTDIKHDEWEEVEDIIAHVLHSCGWNGTIMCSETRNETTLADLNRKSSALARIGSRPKYRNVETTPAYWDCECPSNGDYSHIHPRRQRKCKKCGAERGKQPDSIVSEVVEMLALKNIRAKKKGKSK